MNSCLPLRTSAFAALCVLFAFGTVTIAFAGHEDFGAYHRAADYCRGDVARPMALSPDGRILCFDGEMLRGQDYSLAAELEDGGLFVVRSGGGDVSMALPLGILLGHKHAIVVVYDYCLSACADFLLLASADAFVLRETLVAWHDFSGIHFCPALIKARDGGPQRFKKLPCPGASDEFWRSQTQIEEAAGQFHGRRILDPGLEMPPQSIAVRKRLRSLAAARTCPIDLLWTWHPRHYANAIKTRILYEKFPENQDALDRIASKLPFLHVFYDP